MARSSATPRVGRALHLAAALLPICALQAATTDTPRVHALIQAHGRAVTSELIPRQRALYKMYLENAGYAQSDVVADQAYGTHPAQRLDVFPPLEATSGAPIVVFVHGGGFVSGDKGDGDIYDNVLDYFAARGMLGINMNYRLAPEFGWPAAIDDIRAVVGWLGTHAPDFGGDSRRIFLMGHSAGAAHVAGYIFQEELQLAGGDDGVQGAVLVSGIYAGADIESPHVYYGKEISADSPRLPFNALPGRRMPLFIIDAELDFPRMQREAIALIRAVCERDGTCPRHQQVPGHNHYSIMHHFNTADDSIAHEIAGFVRQWSRPSEKRPR